MEISFPGGYLGNLKAKGAREPSHGRLNWIPVFLAQLGSFFLPVAA